MANSQGSSAAGPLSSPQAYATPPVYGTGSEGFVDPSWYVDSGASTHVTHDLKSLSQVSEYGGQDALIVGDGSGLKTSHSSNIAFSTQS